MAAQGGARQDDLIHKSYITSPFWGLKKEREEAKKLINRQNHAYADS